MEAKYDEIFSQRCHVFIGWGKTNDRGIENYFD